MPSVSLLSLTIPLLSPPSSSLRSDRVPGDDGRGLRVGRPGRSDRPTADAPHLPVHQQRVCLLLVLRPGLRLLPLLPPGLWCGVRGLMSHTQTQQAGWEARQSRPAVVHRSTWQSERCHKSEDRLKKRCAFIYKIRPQILGCLWDLLHFRMLWFSSNYFICLQLRLLFHSQNTTTTSG